MSVRKRIISIIANMVFGLQFSICRYITLLKRIYALRMENQRELSSDLIYYFANDRISRVLVMFSTEKTKSKKMY